MKNTCFGQVIRLVLGLLITLALNSTANAEILLKLQRISDTVAIVTGSGTLGNYPSQFGGNFNLIELDNPFTQAPIGYTNNSILGAFSTMSAGNRNLNFAYDAGGSFTEWGFDGKHPFLYMGSGAAGYLPENSILSGSMQLILKDGSTFAPVGSSGYVSWGAGVMPGGINGYWQMISASGPMPAPTSFAAQAISLPKLGIYGITPRLSLIGNAFTLDVPLYLDSDIHTDDSARLTSGWLSSINKIWSSFDVKDQYGEKFDFNINAHFVDNRSESVSTIRLNDKTGYDNPPCRDHNVINAFIDCPIPRVQNGIMEMYTGTQHYCTDYYTKQYVDCTAADGAAYAQYMKLDSPAPVIPCASIGIAGVALPANLKCLDFGGTSNSTAAHEFGHLLGLPDEYPPDRNSRDPFSPCYRIPTNPREGCAPGVDVGIMGDAAFPIQTRYFDYLFSSLDNYTPGFEWTFGYSPTWNDGNELPYGLPIFNAFEEPPDAPTQVPEPPANGLFFVAALCAALIGSNGRLRHIPQHKRT